MKNITIAAPNEKQLRAMKARTKYIAYGGARGGGKSWFVRSKAILLAARYGGIKILVIRRTYPELENNHIMPLREQLAGIAKYNDQKKLFRFPNNSSIKMGYCAAERDLLQYQGAEYDVIFLDEATQLQEEWILKLMACIRGVNEFPKRMYFTCNPGGPGHGYIKRLFVDRQFKAGEDPAEYAFIQALPQDNVALMAAQPDYLDQLRKLPPKLRKAWLEGRWDVYEGAFFEEFVDDPEHYDDREWTHVIHDFTPLESWRVFRSYDWGYNRPAACGWYTIDGDGILYRVAELYFAAKDPDTGETIPNEGSKTPTDEQFREIARMEREHPYLAGRQITGVADPSIFNANGGISIAENAAKQRVYFSPGDNQRIPGWMQCHYRMMFDAEGRPRFYCFESCREFRRTIPLMQYDERIPEDLDTDMEDHIADEWRYACMSRPIKPIVTAAPEPDMPDPLELRPRRYKMTNKYYTD